MYFRRHIPRASRYLLKPHPSATCMTKLLRFGFEIGISSAPITQKLKATTRTDENKLVISLAHRLRGARQTTCAVHRKLVESLPMTGSNQDSALNKFNVLPAPFALRNFVSGCDISGANLSMRLNFGYCPIPLHLTHDKRTVSPAQTARSM